LESEVLNRLREIVGEGYVLTSPEDLVCYSYDASQPTLDQLPGAVVIPGSVEEVVAILRLANEMGFKVVPRGSGTNLSGGTVPPPGGVVINMLRMDRILEVDERNLTATVEPGVITDALQREVESRGLFYPPDPASSAICTIGGNVAENAGGLRGLKYGVTKDYVLGLEVVLPTGEVLTTGSKCVKDVAGYSLTQLFIGSEGTLGLFTKITLKLIPVPDAKRTMLALFDEMEVASRAVSEIIASKVIPSTMEILDRTTLKYVEEYKGLGIPSDVEALLLLEVDGPMEVVRRDGERVKDICRRVGAREVRVAESEEGAEKLKEARKAALPALARVRPTTILEDVTVPRSEIAPMVQSIREIASRNDIQIAIFGHAGDGNLHPTCMTDERDEEEMKRVEAAFGEIFRRAVELGGTITGEHGVGLKKRPFLALAVGDEGIDTMRRIKQALDPNDILNPGKIFAPR